MRRLPIRLRLTLTFSVVIAVLLTIVAAFAYHRLALGLSDDLNRELRQRAQDLVVPVRRPGSSLEALAGTGFVERGESFAELMTVDGRLLQATETLGEVPLLSPAEAERAGQGTLFVDRPSAPGLDEPARLLATPVSRAGQTVVLVVGDTRENGIETLRRVRTELLVGLPLLLLLTSAGGYLVTGAALRPMETMRRRAATMTAGEPGQRLPIPAGDDEVTRLGETLNALLARVDATVERERVFVANASHELRTPLALLKTQLELAIRRPRPADELREAITSAGDEVDRLIRLAEDLLLLLANADERGLEMSPEQIDLDQLFGDLLTSFRSASAARGRVMSADSGDVETITADRHHLRQALTNLLGNALQHGAGEVRLTAERGPSGWELHVTDEGEGFTEEMLEHGFERFARNRSGGGSGLGLSIIEAVARAHAGSASARNLATGGADVWITLPLTSGTRRSSSVPSTARV